MNNNWKQAFDLMLKSEGGYVHHPSDPGGRTNLGVTQATWENWVGRGSDEAEMRGLTPEKVEPLYKKKYWDVVRADELPSGIDYLVFDMGVNAGPGRSIKLLQTAVGVTPDGGFGPMTMAAVQAADPVELIEKFSFWKEQFYRSLDSFPVYGTGWLNRVADVKVKASAMLA
jgi:lysozyme family protein